MKSAEKIMPYEEGGNKGKQVEQMFDSIAPAYDFMNAAMSFGMHRMWRNKALKAAFASVAEHLPKGERGECEVLDVATGTGDLAFAMLRRDPGLRITGIDLSSGMLNIARDKRTKLSPAEAEHLHFEEGDCLNLQFPDETFSLVTVAYGVRNFEEHIKGLREMHRVLKPGGTLCIIELSVPASALPRLGYNVYSRYLIPMVGRMVSGDHSAYTYLPRSIAAAPQRDDLTSLMRQAGFAHTSWRSLTLGVVTIYLGVK